MRWKDWSKLPDVDDVRFKALRTLVFENMSIRREWWYSIRYYLQRMKESYTIPGARIILFFVQRNNEWSYWEGVETYLIEKYGYAKSTAENVGFKVVQNLCEFDGDRLRLRPEVYSKAVEILENELVAREYAERFDYIVEEWLEAHGYYDSDDEDEEDSMEDSEESEVSEPLVEFVLRDGSRVRVVLEVDVIIRSIRFEGE